jgi:hypothetical protein
MNPDPDPTPDPSPFFIDFILFCRYYFSPLHVHTFMRKKKDFEMDPEPDPYL